MKVIPTKIHGILDYVMVVGLFLLPRLFGWSAQVTSLLTLMAVMMLIYSLLTRYELALFKLLPMPAHLGLDVLSGLALIIAPFMMREPSSTTVIMVILGIAEIAIAALTQTRSEVTETVARNY